MTKSLGATENYLVIDLPEGWGHLVGKGASHNDHVGLSRGCTEHNAVPEYSSITYSCSKTGP